MSSTGASLPAVEDIERIAALSDPVIRNLQITQCYYELSRALRARSGPHANWCTFAAWASKQAGQSIRKEDLRQALEDLLLASPGAHLAVEDTAALALELGASGSREEVRMAIWHAIDLTGAVEHTSQAVARGNLKVFVEIGLAFSRFCALCLDDPAPDPRHLEEFCADLQPGDPPDGQDALVQAFHHLYAALFEPDVQTHAEHMFLANVLIGYHEQTRLQTEIQTAIDAPFIDAGRFMQRLLSLLFPRASRLILGTQMILQRMLGRPPLLWLAAQALLERAHLRTRQAITETLMTIRFPGGLRLRLGRDLSGQYPDCLQNLTMPELLALLQRVDPTPDSLEDSGVLDWASLPDRLHFIVELFRLYHQDAQLFEPPFSAAQTAALKAGRLPDGRL